jgi:hypothetical protein
VVALVAFDVAAVTALRGYLLGQTDSRLQTCWGCTGRLTGQRRHRRSARRCARA